MATELGFCTLHRIAYNRRYDATCPQCLIAHVNGAQQLDYGPMQRQVTESVALPIDPASGKPLDPITLNPVV